MQRPKDDPTAKALAASAVPQADDEKPKATDEVQKRVFSGPEPGETIKPFKVLSVKADQPKEFEIVKETDERTTLICFVHKLGNDDRVLFGLGLVDFYASRHKDLTSHFVLLSDDREKVIMMLRGWARGPLFTKSLVSVSIDGAEGPGYYGLNRNVAMTVLVAKGNKSCPQLGFPSPQQPRPRDYHGSGCEGTRKARADVGQGSAGTSGRTSTASGQEDQGKSRLQTRAQ